MVQLPLPVQNSSVVDIQKEKLFNRIYRILRKKFKNNLDSTQNQQA